MWKVLLGCLLYVAAAVTHAEPRELFVQVSSVYTGSEAYKTRAWFEKACAQTPKLDGLVLGNAADAQGELYTAQLDIVDDYFHCFSNIFIGTVEPDWAGPGSPYVEGIVDPQFRWQQINLSRAVADKLLARYPAVYFHWYITYEANLNFFVGDDVRVDRTVGTPISGYAVKEAYKAFLYQLSGDLYAKRQRTVLWSPTFWTPYASLSATQRSELQSAVRDVLVGSVRVNWLHFQDLIGQQSYVVCQSFSSCYPRVTYPIGCDNTVGYYGLLKAATSSTQVVSLRTNMEMFIMQRAPGNQYGIMPADKNELIEREACYGRNSVPIGASWEIRWWYLSYYGLPHITWDYPQ